MQEKTREQLEREIELRNAFDAERERSDKTYAMKLVEKVVFALVGMMLISVVTAILAGVIIKP